MKLTQAFFLIGSAVGLLNLTGCGGDEKDGERPKPPVYEEDDGDPDIGDVSAAGVFYDKFSGTLDNTKWEPLDQLWGQPDVEARKHGGAISGNVSTGYGFLILKSRGDDYTGALRGVNGFGKRLGAVVKSKQRFASGRFEVKMKVLQVSNVGVLSTAWLFWYKHISKAAYPDAYLKAKKAGNIADADSTVTLNHEIDIEVKGVDLESTIYTNWIGEKNGEYESSEGLTAQKLNDNKFHVYRWDWHTGSAEEPTRIEYYIDNELVRTSTQYVPYIAAHFNVGNWFAWWAGYDTGTYYPPAFDTKEMLVDWVKITPFHETNDDWFE